MIDTAANLVAIALRYLDQLLHQAEFGLATPRPNSSWWGAFVRWIFSQIKKSIRTHAHINVLLKIRGKKYGRKYI
jgi:ABC-type Co2+ transport system permease subunit